MNYKDQIKPIYIENSHVVLISGDQLFFDNHDVQVFTFKEAKEYFNTLIEEEKKHIKKINDQLTEWRNTPPFLNEQTEKFANETILGIHIKIKEYKKQIERLSMRKKHTENKEALNVELAKSVPITNFLQFDRSGFTKCLWHDEKTGSLKYYEKSNSVYCFSCCEHHDVIDVVAKLHNLDFYKAVKLLTH